ncbi:MAG: hypothetical protein KDC53_23865 [Saprospiraceae bacterium]|nr:hypothetical protein [Saprospiraceae bacterium]
METLTIDALPEYSGFVPSAAMEKLRPQVVTAIANQANRFTDILTEYRMLGEQIVDQLSDIQRLKAQIGLIVHMGMLWRDGGNQKEYLIEIIDAQTYAWNLVFDDLHEVICAELDRIQNQ